MLDDNKKVSANIEEYLKIIYQLSGDEELVKTTSIAKSLSIAPGSVTPMLKKMDNLGFVEYFQYKGVKLTEEGLKRAKKVTRKHRLLERFMYDVLKLEKTDIHRQAREMEHSLSDDAERALCQILKHPETCPDDFAPIPECDLKFSSCDECIKTIGEKLEEIGRREKSLISTMELKDHQKGKVSFIRGDHTVIQRLSDMGITIGAIVNVMKIDPLNGPVEVLVSGSKMGIGRDIACNIFVDTEEVDDGLEG